MLPNINDYAALGGEQVNYRPVTNPQTDIDASAWNEVKADTAAMTVTAARAVVRFYWSGSAVVVLYSAAVWQAPPPVITRNGPGEYSVVWPATVVDARGVTRYPNFRWGSGHGSEMAQVVNAKVVAPNEIEALCFDADTGAEFDPSTSGVTVVGY